MNEQTLTRINLLNFQSKQTRQEILIEEFHKYFKLHACNAMLTLLVKKKEGSLAYQSAVLRWIWC